MISHLRALWRFIAFLVSVIALAPVQALVVALRLPFPTAIPISWHRMMMRIVGVDLVVKGDLSRSKSTLFVANHTSYLDISVLGAVIRGSFVAKAEVADWPLFGILAKLQRTVFVDRRARFVNSQREDMRARLEAGDNLILFPEGTSSDGNRVLPFKSALLSVAEIEVADTPITVQPVSVAYTHLDGIPLGRHLRPFYAWYGDMDLFGHLWSMLGMGRVRVVLEFHPPVTIAEFGSRKALTRHCEAAVAAGVAEAITGRPQAPLPEAA